jgi:hypothetical protein
VLFLLRHGHRDLAVQVEAGRFPTGQIAVRDTKDNGAGAVLGFTPQEWTAFIADLKTGDRLTGGLA